MNSIQLSIIIVNFRSEKFLKKCLASIYNIWGEELEVIVVNNDTKESLADISLDFPAVKIVKQEKNFGFGAANNTGAKIAQGEYLLLLNPDTEILSNNLEKIFKKFQENKEVVVIGPRLITGEGETQKWCAGKEFTFWRLIKNNLGIIESKKIWESQKEILADWVSGAALFIKKEIFNKVGGFDEHFFTYFEDDDLCRRIRKVGYKIVYYPEISIKHIGGQCWESVSKQKMHFFNSMAYYVKKHIISQNV